MATPKLAQQMSELEKRKRAKARRLARKIASELFTGAFDEEADRLALVHKEGDSARMSGWCKRAVIDVIKEAIKDHV